MGWGLCQNQEDWKELFAIPFTHVLKHWKQDLKCHTHWVPGTIPKSQFHYLWATKHFISRLLLGPTQYSAQWYIRAANGSLHQTQKILDDEDRNAHWAHQGLPCAVSAPSILSFNSHCNTTKGSWLLFPFQTGGTDAKRAWAAYECLQRKQGAKTRLSSCLSWRLTYRQSLGKPESKLKFQELFPITIPCYPIKRISQS